MLILLRSLTLALALALTRWRACCSTPSPSPHQVARVLLDAQLGHIDLSIDGFWLVFSDPQALALALAQTLTLTLTPTLTLASSPSRRPAAATSANSRRVHARFRSS